MEIKQEYSDNKFQVHIKMLAKVWTGNEKRKNDYLRETGLLGSLRWWCEALVRGWVVSLVIPLIMAVNTSRTKEMKETGLYRETNRYARFASYLDVRDGAENSAYAYWKMTVH